MNRVHWLTPQRLKAYSGMTLLVFSLYVLSVLGRWGMGDHSGHLPWVDFSAFWLVSHFALLGETSKAFDLTAFCSDVAQSMPVSPCGFPWLYPPSYYLMILPLALLPFWISFGAFSALGVTAFVLSLRNTLPGSWLKWGIAAFPGLWMSLLAGQNGCLTASLAGTALLCLHKRPWLSGCLIGTLCIKPQLGLLFPVALLAARAWKAFLAATLSALAWMGAGIMVLGIESWNGWMQQLQLAQRILSETRTVYMMPTAFGFARALGGNSNLAYVIQGLSTLLATGVVWHLWRRDVPQSLRNAALMVGSFLASPYLLYYDLAWLAFPIVWLVQHGIENGWLRHERELLLLAWFSPLLCVFAVYTSIQWTFPVLLGLLLLIRDRAALASLTRGMA